MILEVRACHVPRAPPKQTVRNRTPQGSCKVHSLSAAQEKEIRVELAGDYVPTSVMSPFPSGLRSCH